MSPARCLFYQVSTSAPSSSCSPPIPTQPCPTARHPCHPYVPIPMLNIHSSMPRRIQWPWSWESTLAHHPHTPPACVKRQPRILLTPSLVHPFTHTPVSLHSALRALLLPPTSLIKHHGCPIRSLPLVVYFYLPRLSSSSSPNPVTRPPALPDPARSPEPQPKTQLIPQTRPVFCRSASSSIILTPFSLASPHPLFRPLSVSRERAAYRHFPSSVPTLRPKARSANLSTT